MIRRQCLKMLRRGGFGMSCRVFSYRELSFSPFCTRQVLRGCRLQRLPPPPFVARAFSTEADVRQQTDFGPPNRKGAPKKYFAPYLIEPKNQPGSFRRFIRLVSEHPRLLLASTACTVAYALLTLALPVSFAEIIDIASRGDLPVGQTYYTLVLAAMICTVNAFRLAFVGLSGERLTNTLRSRLFRAVMNRECAFFDHEKHSAGALAQRLTMDTNVCSASLTETMSSGVRDLAHAVGGAVILFSLSHSVGVFASLMVPIMILVCGPFGRRLRSLSTSRQDLIVAQAACATERIKNIKTVKAFAREPQEVEFYASECEKALLASESMVELNAVYHATSMGTSLVALCGIVFVGSMHIAGGQISIGRFVAVLGYTYLCTAGVAGFARFIGELNKAFGASLRIFEILDMDAEGEKPVALPGRRLVKPEGHFRFKDVVFAYPNRSETCVFRGLSMEIPPGMCTAVVGASGSGKSTIASLLLKLYTPQHGEITLDGEAIQNYDHAWLAGIVGYVSQEPVLFNGTIAQNIAYGLSDRRIHDPIDSWTMSTIVEASKEANIHAFIESLPAQYNTLVGESGGALSGGQRQRVAIARALARVPQLLVLDEATSALDPGAERLVQLTIDKIVDNKKRRRSVLIFAHRLSMIRKADRIVVLDEGRVAVEGDFETVRLHPVFRRVMGLCDGDVIANETENQAARAARLAGASESTPLPASGPSHDSLSS